MFLRLLTFGWYNFQSLYAAQPGDYHRNRLTVVREPHIGNKLNAIPITSCGLCLEDNAKRIARGLRLNAVCENLAIAYTVTWLISEMIMVCHVNGVLGKLWDATTQNELVCLALLLAESAINQRTWKFHTNGKRPDGLTSVLWHACELGVWNVGATETHWF